MKDHSKANFSIGVPMSQSLVGTEKHNRFFQWVIILPHFVSSWINFSLKSLVRGKQVNTHCTNALSTVNRSQNFHEGGAQMSMEGLGWWFSFNV